MAGLWLIAYDLDPGREAEYLHWFHETHIPEKLARPGYNWAAHYLSKGAGESGRHRYIALFGGDDSSVFYDPSPEQIKPNQPPETKSMMGFRSNVGIYICSLEWIRNKNEKVLNPKPAIDSKEMDLLTFEVPAGDQTLPSALVQKLWPGLKKQSQFNRLHKYLSSTGERRHIVLVERDIGS